MKLVDGARMAQGSLLACSLSLLRGTVLGAVFEEHQK